MSGDNELTDVCLRLDELVVDVFVTLNKLLQTKSDLESTLKDGYFHLAKARYATGQFNGVSSLQYCEDDLNLALYHVAISRRQGSYLQFVAENTDTDRSDSSGKLSDKVKADVDAEGSKDFSTDGFGLRKRPNVAKSSPREKTSASDQDEKKLEAEENPDDDQHGPAKDTSVIRAGARKDPLLWFGVLVPQALRHSQAAFKRAVSLACEASSLQSKLLALRAEFRSCLRRKAAVKRAIRLLQSCDAEVDDVKQSVVCDDSEEDCEVVGANGEVTVGEE